MKSKELAITVCCPATMGCSAGGPIRAGGNDEMPSR